MAQEWHNYEDELDMSENTDSEEIEITADQCPGSGLLIHGQVDYTLGDGSVDQAQALYGLSAKLEDSKDLDRFDSDFGEIFHVAAMYALSHGISGTGLWQNITIDVNEYGFTIFIPCSMYADRAPYKLTLNWKMSEVFTKGTTGAAVGKIRVAMLKGTRTIDYRVKQITKAAATSHEVRFPDKQFIEDVIIETNTLWKLISMKLDRGANIEVIDASYPGPYAFEVAERDFPSDVSPGRNMIIEDVDIGEEDTRTLYLEWAASTSLEIWFTVPVFLAAPVAKQVQAIAMAPNPVKAIAVVNSTQVGVSPVVGNTYKLSKELSTGMNRIGLFG